MDFDLVINHAEIIDGTGKPRFHGHLGLQGGKIAAVSTDEPLAGGRVYDAAGLAVTPGFIDIHSHADWILPLREHATILAPLVLQGITTLVAGTCGFSPAPCPPGGAPALDALSEMCRDQAFPYRWNSFGEFLDTLEGDGVLLNTACLVGHGSLRALVMKARSAAPDPSEMESLRCFVRQSIHEGAFGFSAGLAYAPGVFARNEELLELLRVTAEADGVFTVHGRAYTWVSPFYKPMFFNTPHNVLSTRELLGLARQAGVRLELSHLIFVGRRTWRTHPTVLQDIERAVEAGQPVGFDAFPYTVGNSTVNVIFPEWFLDGFRKNVNDPAALKRLKREIRLLQLALGIRYDDLRLLEAGDAELAELNGVDIASAARRLKLPEFEAYMHIARRSLGSARLLLGTYSGDERSEQALQAVLSHPLCSFITDTILTSKGAHNPASFGTYPRLLGRYSRDLKLFSLEEAVRRMTSLPASRIGLEEVGRIVPGYWGDLVLFNPRQIADHTTPEHPDRAPSGICAVLISGQIVAQDGKMISEKLYGRVLRKG